MYHVSAQGVDEHMIIIIIIIVYQHSHAVETSQSIVFKYSIRYSKRKNRIRQPVSARRLD